MPFGRKKKKRLITSIISFIKIFFAFSREFTFQNLAVGIFASCINSFAQDLLYSNFAPSLPGPKTLKFSLRRKSASPSAKGISGPITIKSTFKKSSFSNNSFLFLISIFILSHLFILSDPALPGIKKTFLTNSFF